MKKLKGRKGKGVIYVWAGGNGGLFGDNCGCDGFINSIYTIAINGVNINGSKTFYTEPCAAIMAAVYVGSGGVNKTSVVSSDLRNNCIKGFSGTSAAAPIAAGILALVLEAK